MRTQFFNRAVATTAYRRYRRTWDRNAAWVLTVLHHAVEPDKRLAAALALECARIPFDGVWRD